MSRPLCVVCLERARMKPDLVKLDAMCEVCWITLKRVPPSGPYPYEWAAERARRFERKRARRKR